MLNTENTTIRANVTNSINALLSNGELGELNDYCVNTLRAEGANITNFDAIDYRNIAKALGCDATPAGALKFARGFRKEARRGGALPADTAVGGFNRAFLLCAFGAIAKSL